jgi:hypothetical protein
MPLTTTPSPGIAAARVMLRASRVINSITDSDVVFSSIRFVLDLTGCLPEAIGTRPRSYYGSASSRNRRARSGWCLCWPSAYGSVGASTPLHTYRDPLPVPSDWLLGTFSHIPIYFHSASTETPCKTRTAWVPRLRSTGCLGDSPA